MQVMRTMTIGVMAVVGMTGCSDTSGPSDGRIPVEVTYTPRGADPGTEPPPRYVGSAAVRADDSRLVITTKFFGDLCRMGSRAVLDADGRNLKLSVKLEPRPGLERILCLAWVAETDVVATTATLPPGSYRVVVNVRYPSGSASYSYNGGTAIIQ